MVWESPASTHAKRHVERIYGPESVAIDTRATLPIPDRFRIRGIHASGYRGKLVDDAAVAGFGY